MPSYRFSESLQCDLVHSCRASTGKREAIPALLLGQSREQTSSRLVHQEISTAIKVWSLVFAVNPPVDTLLRVFVQFQLICFQAGLR